MILECIKSTSTPETLAGFLTPIIAVVTVIIAVITAFIFNRQQKDARYKIKVDLFDKRMAVYQLIEDQLLIAIRDTKPNIDYRELNSAQAKSKFLFDDKIHNAVKKIIETIIANINANQSLSVILSDPAPNAAKVNQLSNEIKRTSDLLMGTYDNFADIFSDFMTLNKI